MFQPICSPFYQTSPYLLTIYVFPLPLIKLHDGEGGGVKKSQRRFISFNIQGMSNKGFP
jgi:hypothetical protein